MMGAIDHHSTCCSIQIDGVNMRRVPPRSIVYFERVLSRTSCLILNLIKCRGILLVSIVEHGEIFPEHLKRNCVEDNCGAEIMMSDGVVISITCFSFLVNSFRFVEGVIRNMFSTNTGKRRGSTFGQATRKHLASVGLLFLQLHFDHC